MAATKRAAGTAAAKRAVKKATAKKAAPRRTAGRQVPLEAARKAAEVRSGETEALREGDELPLVVVKGKKRPKARLQLGEGGKIYIVTKPKDDLYYPLVEQLADLQGLAHTEISPETLTPEQAKQLAGAMELMKIFVTCAFAEEDRDEVLAYLERSDNDEQRDDLAAAMQELMEHVWADADSAS